MTGSVRDLFDRFREIETLSVGHVTHDFFGDRIVPGGCAFYGAKTFSALGARSKLATTLGRDFACHGDLSDLEVCSVECPRTTVFTNLYPEGKARVQLVRAQAEEVAPQPDRAELYRADLVFVAPVMAEVDYAKWQGIRGEKLTVLSLQGFLKHAPQSDQRSERLVVANRDPFDAKILRGIDAVFFSEEDLALFGSPGLIDDLLENVSLVFMTQGEAGCTVLSSQGSLHVAAYETEAVDPTGAGDTFAAAAALALAAGASARQAAQIGAAAASIVVEGTGGECLARVCETQRRIMAFDR